MRALLRLLLSRLLQGAALLLALSFLLFGVMAHLPGDPVDLLVASNPALSPSDVQRLKKLRGLDQPFPVRWWRWLYGHHAAKAPPPPVELPAVVGVLPAPRPFVVDVALPPHDGLALSAFAPAVVVDKDDGAHITALLPEAGAVLLLIRATDTSGVAGGQDALWTLPVYVAPPAPAVLHPITTGEEGGEEGGDDDAAAHASPENELDPRTGPALRAAAVAKRALDAVPGTVDVVGSVGVHVVDRGGVVVVEDGDPVVDEDAFEGGVVFGELGWSWATKRPVKELLFGAADEAGVDVDLATRLASMGRIENTLVLTLPSLLLSMLFALALGSWAAARKDRVVDVVVRGFAAVCGSVPAFFVALVFITLFAEELRWFPSGGLQTPGIQRDGVAAVVVDRVQHLALPLSVLVIFWSGRFVRQVRSAVLSSLSAEFVRTARSRGLSSSSTFLRHVLPNAALPLITLVGLSLPTLFGGALLTETVFAWPGLGRLQYDAILQNDSYVAVVVFLGSAAVVLCGSLFADLAVFALDPRLRRDDGSRR